MKINWHWPHVEPRVGDVFPRGWDLLPWYEYLWRTPWFIVALPFRFGLSLCAAGANRSAGEGFRAWEETR